jgi:hypothetical protein
VFWLCYRWEDSHELTIIPCDDILLKVLSFSIDTLQHLLVLFTSMVATWKFSIYIWVFSMKFVAITKSKCLNITVSVVRVKQVISFVMEVVLAAWLSQRIQIMCHWIIGKSVVLLIVTLIISVVVVMLIHMRLGSSSISLLEAVIEELEQVLLEKNLDLNFLKLLLSSSSTLVSSASALAVLPILFGWLLSLCSRLTFCWWRIVILKLITWLYPLIIARGARKWTIMVRLQAGIVLTDLTKFRPQLI